MWGNCKFTQEGFPANTPFFPGGRNHICYNQYINQQMNSMSNLKFTVFGIRWYWLQRDEHRECSCRCVATELTIHTLRWRFTHMHDEQWKARGTAIYRLLSETSRVSLAYEARQFCLHIIMTLRFRSRIINIVLNTSSILGHNLRSS